LPTDSKSVIPLLLVMRIGATISHLFLTNGSIEKCNASSLLGTAVLIFIMV
jgi:hypothetical protein